VVKPRISGYKMSTET